MGTNKQDAPDVPRYCPYCGYQEVVRHSDGTITCARCLRRYDTRLWKKEDLLYEQEIWLPVNGFEGLYEVSNYMRVRRVSHYTRGRHIYGRILSPYPKNNEIYVSLHKNGKWKEYNVRSLYREADGMRNSMVLEG